ncbi:MAG TPA: hypothetical protein VE959_29360, partial [Bryobacteraceae bacterium]|nr:hypothetical protein [Bryobacteraceae bacterium]
MRGYAPVEDEEEKRPGEQKTVPGGNVSGAGNVARRRERASMARLDRLTIGPQVANHACPNWKSSSGGSSDTVNLGSSQNQIYRTETSAMNRVCSIFA